MIKNIEKLEDWFNKRHILTICFILLVTIGFCVYLPIILLSIKTSIKSIFPYMGKTFPEYANASSITGYGIGLIGISVSLIAITIAFRIYKNQTVDLTKTVNAIKTFQETTLTKGIKNIEHMAFSLKSLEIGDLSQKVRELVQSRKATHLTVISRYSAMPAFWLDVRYNKNKPILMNEIISPILKSIDKMNMLFIGPDEATFKCYAHAASVDSDSTWDNYIDYIRGQGLIERHIQSDKVTSMGANAIILKYDDANDFGSKYEVIFFGESDDKDDMAEVFKTPKIYHAQVGLMVRLWRYELKTIIADHVDSISWLRGFYENFLDEKYDNA